MARPSPGVRAELQPPSNLENQLGRCLAGFQPPANRSIRAAAALFSCCPCRIINLSHHNCFGSAVAIVQFRSQPTPAISSDAASRQIIAARNGGKWRPAGEGGDFVGVPLSRKRRRHQATFPPFPSRPLVDRQAVGSGENPAGVGGQPPGLTSVGASARTWSRRPSLSGCCSIVFRAQNIRGINWGQAQPRPQHYRSGRLWLAAAGTRRHRSAEFSPAHQRDAGLGAGPQGPLPYANGGR